MSIPITSPQDLVRQAVMQVVTLPDQDLVAVMELIADLKAQAQARETRRQQAAALLARAKQRAAELQHLPRPELLARFEASLERIRLAAIANGTALDEDLQGD